MPTGPDDGDWIGRSEERRDVVTPGPLDRLAATLDRNESFASGDAVPPGWHWLFCLPHAAQSGLGPDGHARRGGFLPPLDDLPRRMWAGSRISFPGDLIVGQDILQRSTIASVRRKSGRSGLLAFVTVRHELGVPGQAPAIVDEHDIIYRGLNPHAPVASADPAATGTWRRVLTPHPILLFRYSALTFNGHRIHYDRDYAVTEEGYPGLVVHGPLTATLLLDLLRRMQPQARLASFAFRAVSPLFAGEEMSLNGTPPDDRGVVQLWASGPGSRLAMTAQATLADARRPAEMVASA